MYTFLSKIRLSSVRGRWIELTAIRRLGIEGTHERDRSTILTGYRVRRSAWFLTAIKIDVP